MSKYGNLLLDKIVHNSQIQPQKIALKFLESDYQSSQELSYQQLSEKVLRLAHLLYSLQEQSKLPAQKPILLLFDSSINYVVSFLSVLYSGNVAVTAYPPRQIRHLQRLLKIINDSSASMILTTGAVQQYCEENHFEFPQETTLICVDKLIENQLPLSSSLPDVRPEHIAFLQYTSGSTGSPKGVVVTHKNICANLDLLENYLGHDTVSKCVSWLPIFHDMGLIGNTLLPLYTGGTCVFMEPFTFLKNPFFWLQAISANQGTYTMAPNFSYDLALSALKNKDPSSLDLDFSSVCCLVNGAEPIRPETIRRFEETLEPYNLKKLAIKPGYGMAETTLCISVEMASDRLLKVNKKDLDNGIIKAGEESQDALYVELVRCGKIHEDYCFRIVNPNSLQVLPVNTVGELWIQGNSVASGYYQNQEKTKEIFQAFTSDTGEGPFLRTGDLAFIDTTGCLIICGRVKDLIIINGRNIYPQDIESACYQSDSALIPHGAAAFSINPNGTEECVLIAEAKEGLQETQYREIMAKIKKAVFESTEISLYDIVLIAPRKILKTSSGKIQRSACKLAYQNDGFEQLANMRQQIKQAKENQPKNAPMVSENSTVIWLKEWIAKHTTVALDEIEADRAFAEYGLTSIQLVTMVNDLEQLVKCSLEPWLAWEFPNIQSLSLYLSQDTASGKTSTQRTYEPIAIIGMDCRLPGANYEDLNGVDAFWQSLLKEQDSIEPIPVSRWDNRLYYDSERNKNGKMYCSEGGFLNDIKRFDAKFFNISPREAEYLDPQQRLALTTTWHALEDAGLLEQELKNSHTGIYLGISTHDYDQLIQKQVPLEELGTYQATGTSFATSAGRIAYFLGTTGPCMAIDTACSSSLVSIHQASRALQEGDCQLAIAGGVNLILSPEGNIIFCKSRMLSPKNRCSTFDISADGYVRGEGCGMVVLKKLSDALRDGNRIHAVIYGSAVNQDGASNGLTAPNLAAQVEVINTALDLAHLQPEQITHVEAHGTGTELGDPIEWEGIRRSYAQDRKNPLYITSVKTRIGHLEAAAGIAGLIKTVLAIKYGQIPAHLNLNQLNPKLSRQDSMIIPRQAVSWNDEHCYAGVSSFGFSGTNAHIILGKPAIASSTEEYVNRPEHLWVVSAKDPEALHRYLHNYCAYAEQNPEMHFPSFCYQMVMQRAHFSYRAFIVAKDQSSWLAALQQQRWQEGRTVNNNQLAWLFTGQGCLQPKVATVLYQTIPEFAAVVEQCCAIAQSWLPYDLRAILLNTPEEIDVNNTLYAQPALFVYEYSLAQWFLHLGLKPNMLLGHSLGEYVAACIAGILSLHDALYLVCKRAVLISSLPVHGGMLAINAPALEVESFITQFNELVIALKNGPEQTVVSGTDDAILACQNYCVNHAIRCKRVATSHAFHSPLMKPIVDEFAKIAKEVTYHPAKIPVVSNVTGRILDAGQINAEYWRLHMLQTVEFHQGIQTLVEHGIELCQEIGPKPILIAQAQMVHDFTVLPSVSEPENPWPGIMETLGVFYLRGVDIKWHVLNKHATFVHEELLKYPFDGKEYWLPQISGHTAVATDLWKTYLYHEHWQKLSINPALISLENEQVILISNKPEAHEALFYCNRASFISIRDLQSDIVAKSVYAEVLKQADWIVYCCSFEIDDLMNELTLFTDFIKYLVQQLPEKPVLLLGDKNSLQSASLLALLKSVKHEYPQWPIHYLEVGLNEVDSPLQFIGSRDVSHWALRFEQGAFYHQEISPVAAEQIEGKRKLTADFSCLVTGACGDVGQAVIESLSTLGARFIIAVGRKEKESAWSELIERQKNQGTRIIYYSCNVADAAAVFELIEHLPTDFPPLGVIVHAAGVAHDKPWGETTEQDIQEVFGAKAIGAWNLHQATINHPVQAFIFISSLSAVFGNQGQAVYAAANAFLNALSSYRHQHQQPAQSLILGPIKHTGLFKHNEQQLTHYLAEKGIVPLLRSELQEVFQTQINEPNLIVSHFLHAPALVTKSLSSTSEQSIQSGEDIKKGTAESILAIVEEVLRLAPGELSSTDNWFEFGMDSIMATQLISKINRKYTNAHISSKDVFNHASAQQLAFKLDEATKEVVPETSLVSRSIGYRPTHTFPLSLQQQEIWNFIKNSPKSLAYQIPMDLTITGNLSIAKLQKALADAMLRHDILRCSFHEILHQVNQHVHDECKLPLDVYEEYDAQQVAHFLTAPFDLSKPPLIRTCLIREGDSHYRWLLVFHHLLCDGYTVTAFIKEVIAHYENHPVEDKVINYSDYVNWQWDNVLNQIDNEIAAFGHQHLQEVPMGVVLARNTQQPQEAGVIYHQLPLKDINASLGLLEKNKLSLSNYILANLFTILLDAFQQEQQGIITFFSGREDGMFSSVFGDTSNDVLLVGQRDANIFSQTENLQQQIFDLHEKQYFQMPVFKELGLATPMISFDFQRSSDLNIKTQLQIKALKNGNIQNYLWGDEPRLLSFKVLLKAQDLEFSLKYRRDKIDDSLAHSLLDAWINKLTTQEQHNNCLLVEDKPLALYEASVMQSNLWQLLKSHPDGMPYYVPLFKEVNDSIDLERLNRVVNRLIQNTPALQVFFIENEGKLNWNLDTKAHTTVQIINCAHIYEALGSLLVTPLALTQAPLFKLYLIHSQDNKKPILLIRLHHLIADGIAAELFFKELEKNYLMKENSITPDTQQGGYLYDYRQEKALYAENKVEYGRYFLELNQRLEKHHKVSPSGIPNYVGGVVYRNLTKDVSKNVVAFCTRHNISPYTFYFHLFCITLGQLSNQETIYISIVKSNRGRLINPDTIGYYADNLPFLFELTPDICSIEAIKNTQMQILDLIGRFQYPLHAKDAESLGYIQPPVIFNQYTLEHSHAFIDSADYLIEGIINASGKQVSLWNYNNPEQFNLLIRSDHFNNMMGLVYNQCSSSVEEAELVLGKFIENILSFL